METFQVGQQNEPGRGKGIVSRGKSRYKVPEVGLRLKHSSQSGANMAGWSV